MSNCPQQRQPQHQRPSVPMSLIESVSMSRQCHMSFFRRRNEGKCQCVRAKQKFTHTCQHPERHSKKEPLHQRPAAPGRGRTAQRTWRPVVPPAFLPGHSVGLHCFFNPSFKVPLALRFTIEEIQRPEALAAALCI